MLGTRESGSRGMKAVTDPDIAGKPELAPVSFNLRRTPAARTSPTLVTARASVRAAQPLGGGSPGPHGGASLPGIRQPISVVRIATGTRVVSLSTRIGPHMAVSVTITSGRHRPTI